MFGNVYILFVRVSDAVSLVLSQLLTLFGSIQFRSANEIVNRRNPARFMRWSKREQLLNQFNGGFLLDGKVGRVSRTREAVSVFSSQMGLRTLRTSSIVISPTGRSAKTG